MIKIKKQDSLVDILRKIKNSQDETIILDFPFGHPILHNYSSLKIIAKKTKDKELIIATNDKTAKKIGKTLGLRYTSTKNPDLIGHNYNFGEYLVYTIKSYFTRSRNYVIKKSSDNRFSRYQQKYASGKIGFFIAFLLLSIVLLFFVFYFAVNKTYVYITPEIEVKTKGHNFIFKELPEEESVLDDKVIKLKKRETTVSTSENFGTSGIQTDSLSLANGLVTLYNLLPEEVELVKGTRLQTKDGLVFLLETEVTLPPADTSGVQVEPGTAETSAIARLEDIEGAIIGKNGNIPKETSFVLPGLTENKDKIYAVAKEDFSGGDSNFTRILSEQDIENAKGILEKKLQKEALTKLKEEIEAENEGNNVSYEVLLASDTLIYSDLVVNGLENLEIDSEMKSFSLQGSINIAAYTYNKDILLGKMSSIIQQTTVENVEKILNIDESSLALVNEISRSEEYPFTTKQTVFVDVYFVQNFDTNSSYVERIKGSIVGETIDDAQKILINNPKISNADVKIRPFFIKNVSKFINNIEFIVEDEF